MVLDKMVYMKELFEAQKILRDRIDYEQNDRFDKLCTSLLVEIGEALNEARFFKFWSVDQEPRTKIEHLCSVCDGTGDENYEMIQEDAEGNGGHEYINCEDCKGTGKLGESNPLLEEIVDVLHFILDLGLEFETDLSEMGYRKEYMNNLTDQSNRLFLEAARFNFNKTIWQYRELMAYYLGLVDYLGFTWEEVETAYFLKNKKNHARQDSGTY